MKKTLITATVAILAILSSMNANAQNEIKEGEMFRDFTVQQDPSDPNSKASLSDYVGKGKWVVADFWASWCGWCIKEIPYLKSINNDFPKDKVIVLSIAINDRPEDTRAAAAKHGVNWAQIINTKDVAVKLYGIRGIPYTVVFNPQGRVAAIGLRGENLYKFVKLVVEN